MSRPSEPQPSRPRQPLDIVLAVLGAGLLLAVALSDTLRLPLIGGSRFYKTLLLVPGIVLLGFGAGRLFAHPLLRFFAPQPQPGVRRLLATAAWFGLLAGFGEAVLLPVRHYAFARGLHFNEHTLWMYLVVDLVLFAAAALVLWALGRRWPRISAMPAVALALAILVGLAWVLALPELHTGAGLLLAVPLAVGTARKISAHDAGFGRLVRWTLPVLVLGGVALWGVVVFRSERVLQQMAQRERLASVHAQGPNVLLIVLDTVRSKSLSLYGYGRDTTPNLKRIAETGVCFDRAVSTSPWTLPGHGGMFTGRMPHELFEPGSTPLTAMVRLGDRYPTLAEVLGEQGYSTAGIVANFAYCSTAHGLDRGFAHYEDYKWSVETAIASSSLSSWLYRSLRSLRARRERDRKSADEVNDAFLSWLDGQPQQPFFAFLNYFDAHSPYNPRGGFESKFSPKPVPPTDLWVRKKYGPKGLRRLGLAYDSCIGYLDDRIGKLFDQLGARGLLDNTLLIVVSDHGEMQGEHGFVGHTSTLYGPVLHVPLIVSWPGHVPAGRRVEPVVSLADLPATVMDVLGLQDRSPFPGVSLAWHWTDGAKPLPDSDRAFSEVMVGERKPPVWLPSWPGYEGGMEGLFADGYHYIRLRDAAGTEELYHVADDPHETTDLAGDPKAQDVLKRMRQMTGGFSSR